MMGAYTVHTSTLFDPKKKRFVRNVSIKVNTVTGNISKVYERTDELGSTVPEGDVDLRGQIVLPGLVDAHTHVFLHSYDERPSLEQKRDESQTERTVRAVNHCRAGLLAGYTTYRDLGSESMMEADAKLRDCIARGLMPGPRLFVATRVLACTGAYEPRTENHAGGTCLPRGAEAVDGVEEIRKAVRRRIALGADVIKFYADYRRRIMRYPPAQQHPYKHSVIHPPANPNPDVLVFNQEEMNTIVEEAKLAQCPAVAHCGTVEGVLGAIRAGVTSVEHAYFATEEVFSEMAKNKVIFVPTLAVCERLHAARFDQIKAQTKMAHQMGVRLACGGDTGTYPHGENAREIELIIECGVPVEDAIEACTVGGWESCGGEQCGLKFGWFEEGARADIIALETDPREDTGAFRKVNFVMKDATVWKLDGKPVGMY